MRKVIRQIVFLLLAALPARTEIVDRIVAVVGGRAVAWSAAYEEARYQAFRKGEVPPLWSASEPKGSDGMDAVLTVLIDQALLQQALSRSPFALSGSEDIAARVREIRQGYLSEGAYRAALERCRLSEEQLGERLARESLLLAFVDATLRPQVRLTAEQVEGYYRDVFLPELQSAQAAAAPPIELSMEQVRPQIEEILTQQQINRLLEQWLEQLRRSTRIEKQ